jgi:hypothetical protein
MVKLLTWMIFFGEIHVFLHLCWIYLFGANRAYLYLEIQNCRKYSFQEVSQFSQGNNELYAPAYNRNDFLWKDTCFFFFNWVEYAYLDQTEPMSTLKHLRGRKYSFQKVTQLSQGSNVLDVRASSRLFSFKRYMCSFKSAEQACL